MAFFIQSLAMQIIQDTAVTIKYQVTSPAGKPLDSGHLSYLHGVTKTFFQRSKRLSMVKRWALPSRWI